MVGISREEGIGVLGTAVRSVKRLEEVSLMHRSITTKIKAIDFASCVKWYREFIGTAKSPVRYHID